MGLKLTPGIIGARVCGEPKSEPAVVCLLFEWRCLSPCLVHVDCDVTEGNTVHRSDETGERSKLGGTAIDGCEQHGYGETIDQILQQVKHSPPLS